MTVPPLDGLLDPAAARAALADTTTGAADLSLIAQYHPALRAEVAMHPAAYSGLLDWLDGVGDPVLSAVVNLRRQGSGTAPAQPTPAAEAGPSPWSAAAQGAAPQAPIPQGFVPQAPIPQGFVPQASVPQPAMAFPAGAAGAPAVPVGPKRPRRNLLIGAGAVVVAVALAVSMFATRGFGLFAAGGAATPEEEAVKVATKTVELFNSISARSLLSNPLSAMSSLTDEYAPSEARVAPRPGLSSGASNAVLDTTEVLGLSGDSLNLVTEVAGSFQVQATDLKTEVTEITSEIAAVTFVEGTVTVTADVDKFRQALERMPDVVSKQIALTAEKYGLHPTPVNVADHLPAGWLDDAVDEVKDRFPVTVNLADYDRWLNGEGAEPPNMGIASFYRQASAVIVVKEAGRWYLSPMLTSHAWGNGAAGAVKDLRADADDERLLSVEPSQNKSPAEAATAFAQALSTGRERAVLAQLPLAERRYAAFTGVGDQPGILSQLSSMEGSERPEVRFSEIARSGDQVKLRIDEYSPVYGSGDSAVSIEDGTCLTGGSQTYCLADYLDPEGVTDAIERLREAPWGSFEETTGISPDDVVDKLGAAARRAIESVKPDQIGIVVIQENGGWFVSATATVGELQNQANAVVLEGVKAAQGR